MNSEQITAFLQEHWYAHRHSRGYRRVVFFLLGVLLIVVSIWGFVLKLK